MDWWIVVLRKERLHPILNSLDKATVSVLLSSLSLSVLTSLNRSLSNSITLSCQGVSLLAAFNRTDLRWLPRWICTYILVRRGERKREREREREREEREKRGREVNEVVFMKERLQTIPRWVLPPPRHRGASLAQPFLNITSEKLQKITPPCRKQWLLAPINEWRRKPMTCLWSKKTALRRVDEELNNRETNHLKREGL